MCRLHWHRPRVASQPQRVDVSAWDGSVAPQPREVNETGREIVDHSPVRTIKSSFSVYHGLTVTVVFFFLLNIPALVSALELLKNAIAKAGYTDKIVIGMDVAASEFYKGGKYDLDFKSPDDPSRYISADQLADLYRGFVKDYPGSISAGKGFSRFSAAPEWPERGTTSLRSSQMDAPELLLKSLAEILVCTASSAQQWCPSRTPLTRTIGRRGPILQPAPAFRWWATTSRSPTPNASPRVWPRSPATACCSK